MASHFENTNFPEDGNEVIPAQQKTVDDLLTSIRQKTEIQFDYGHGSVTARLHEPGSRKQVGIVIAFQEDKDSGYPRRLASIHSPQGASHFGHKINTNYFISRIPDGLHIEKRVIGINPRKNRDHLPKEEAIATEAAELLINLAMAKANEPTEQKLGLNFVSQKEAGELLETVSRLEAFDDHADNSRLAEWLKAGAKE